MTDLLPAAEAAPVPPPKDATRVIGLRVDPMTMPDALDRLDGMISDRQSAVVHLCNAWCAVLAGRDKEYARALDGGTLNLADGKSIVWSSRLLGVRRPHERVTGRELMLGACERGVARGTRHYFYGGAPGVADEMADELRRRYPGIRIVGTESPPYRPLTADEEGALAKRLHASEADLVWVGLGTPTQDLFIARFVHRVEVGALLGVGAAFDFLAGRKRSAPAWMQRSGLEWAFRLVSEPRRLWKRYLIGNTVFLARLSWQLAGRSLGPIRRRQE